MMTTKLIFEDFTQLLKKYPELKSPLEKGFFLTGYTSGSPPGEKVTVFLVRSPWTQFCLQATAMGLLPPGAVLLVTDKIESGLNDPWKAYSLEPEMLLANNQRDRELSKTHRNHGRSSSHLASLAAEIALENNQQKSLKAR